MKIISLTGTQNIIGGENYFHMVVEAGGEAYNIPIGFDTYQLLNELAVVSRQESPVPVAPREQPVFSPPAPGPTLAWDGEDEQERPEANPIDQLSKIGLFEPQSVLEAVQSAPSSEDELMGILEDTSDDDEEDDPGEMSIDDSVGQYTGD